MNAAAGKGNHVADFNRILKSADEKLPDWRLRVSAPCAHDVDIAEEFVHPEQIDNPIARHTKRRDRLCLMRPEAEWLRDALTAWLAEHPDDGAACGLLAGEERCR